VAEQELDLSKGWCCNGKTWTEHAHESSDGKCCQPEGAQLDDLPEDGRQKAQERLAGGSPA
jgi:hypothetical protein